MNRISGNGMTDISRSRKPTADEFAAFRAYLQVKYGTGSLSYPVDNALYGKAWNMSHPHGYLEVEHHYGELADLVLLAYRSN